MEGVRTLLVLSSRACADGFGVGDEGGGAFCDRLSVFLTFSFNSLEIWCPDWIKGSDTLPVSRLCDTVVILARKGKRNVGGRAERVSKRDRRSVWPSSAIVVESMDGMLLLLRQPRCEKVWKDRE